MFKGEKIMKQKPQAHFLARTHWDAECFDKEGKLKSKSSGDNICTDEGLNALLNVMFLADTPVEAWYIALFGNDHTPTGAETYAVPVFTECVTYSGTRRLFDGTLGSKVVTNSAAKAEFAITDTATVYGAALVGGGTSPDVAGDTAGGGIIYAVAPLAEAIAVVEGDTLKITCTITASDVT